MRGGLGSGAAAAPVPCPAAGERPRGTEPAAAAAPSEGCRESQVSAQSCPHARQDYPKYKIQEKITWKEL